MHLTNLVPAGAWRGLLLCLIGFLWLGGAVAPAAAQDTVVAVVRHAEKETVGDDPGLSAPGARRAAALAATLASAGVGAVYATEFRRTRETALPLAERVGAPVVVRAIRGADVEAYHRSLAREILERHRGGTVLVVGHSNTVSLMISALGGEAPGPLPEDQYGDLYLVLVSGDGAVRTVQARYGAP